MTAHYRSLAGSRREEREIGMYEHILRRKTDSYLISKVPQPGVDDQYFYIKPSNDFI